MGEAHGDTGQQAPGKSCHTMKPRPRARARRGTSFNLTPDTHRDHGSDRRERFFSVHETRAAVYMHRRHPVSRPPKPSLRRTGV